MDVRISRRRPGGPPPVVRGFCHDRRIPVAPLADTIWLHLPAVLWGAYIEFSGGICPLTPLENQLLAWAGETGYSGGFVEHYLLPILYPDNLTAPIQWLLGGCVVVVNMLAYGLVYRDWA